MFTGQMFKILLILNLFVGQLFTPLPPPEIWAEPVPFFMENQLGNYAVPLSERGPGHRGIDFFAGEQEIRLPVTGEVVFHNEVVNRNLLTIKSAGRLISLEPVCSDLAEGDRVARNQIIASYCPGGDDYLEHCKGCVHLSVRTNRGYLNPLLFFGKLLPSVIVD